MPITMLYAGILGLILIALTIRVVVVVRAKGKVLYGDDANPVFSAIVRAHANFIEYVPHALILMALLELNVGNANLLHGLGITLVVARILHAQGLHPEKPLTPGRFLGSLGTWLVIAVASITAIWKYF